ncbi:sigma-54-dependent Fis family transcriptional regulator, partial [Myxococcota bacterium]|nr:sigma-54-dependent Fis family transcriptional regulator [Myxococcota bacterium]
MVKVPPSSTASTRSLNQTIKLNQTLRASDLHDAPRYAHLLLLCAPELHAPTPLRLAYGVTRLGRSWFERKGFGFDGTLSDAHLELRVDEQRVTIRDLNSTNGTFLNGCALSPKVVYALEDQDTLRLGETLLVFSAEPLAPLEHDPHLPGITPALVHTRAKLRALAQEHGPVLLQAETGTGKEWAVKLLHQHRDPRAPLVKFNAAHLLGLNARVDLFGAEKGAYTDATNRLSGIVEQAHGGLLFLDEIAEIPLNTQAMMLRFLEDSSYRPLGSNRDLHSSAFVIAATNADLERAVMAGRFRTDLRARLVSDTQAVDLPPMRRRRFDVTLWLELFIQARGARGGYTARFVEALCLYPWPENLREFKQTVFDALRARGDEPRLDVHHLSEPLQGWRRALRAEGDPRWQAAPAAARLNPGAEPRAWNASALIA